MPILVDHELRRLAVARPAGATRFTVGQHHRIEQHGRRILEACRRPRSATPSLVSTAPSRGAMTLGTAPAAAAPPARRPPRRRPRHRRPGSRPCACGCRRRRAGPSATVPATSSPRAWRGCASALGMAAGTAMPSPSATVAASSADTLTSDDSMRSRIAGTVSLLSSKRKPPAMCAFSTVGLAFVEQRGLRVVVGELLRLAAQLVVLRPAAGTTRSPPRRPGTGSRRRASWARRRRGRGGWPGGAGRRAGCCAPAPAAR